MMTLVILDCCRQRT